MKRSEKSKAHRFALPAMAVAVVAMLPVTATAEEDIGGLIGKAILEGLREGLEEEIVTEKPKKRRQAKWRVGDRVLGQWTNGKWYPAQVQRYENDGYFIVFDDGDTRVVQRDEIAPFSWERNTRLECKDPNGSGYESATLRSFDRSSIFVKFDYGEKVWLGVNRCRNLHTPPNVGQPVAVSGFSEMQPPPPPAQVAPPEIKRTAPPPPLPRQQRQAQMNRPGYFSAGSRALGYWNGYWYSGSVIVANRHNYSFKIDGGGGQVYKMTSSEMKPIYWNKGTVVECNWNGAGRYYSGTIIARHGKQAQVRYLGGQVENTVIGNCRSAR